MKPIHAQKNQRRASRSLVSTTELPYAAFLRLKYGLAIKDVQHSEKGRLTWVFDSNGLDEKKLFQEFIAGGSVPACKYFQEIKFLKSMLYR